MHGQLSGRGGQKCQGEGLFCCRLSSDGQHAALPPHTPESASSLPSRTVKEARKVGVGGWVDLEYRSKKYKEMLWRGMGMGRDDVETFGWPSSLIRCRAPLRTGRAKLPQLQNLRALAS